MHSRLGTEPAEIRRLTAVCAQVGAQACAVTVGNAVTQVFVKSGRQETRMEAWVCRGTHE